MLSNLPTINDWIFELESNYTIIDVINCDAYKPNSVDLYNRIKQNYRPEFSKNDRIIITFSKDYYKDQNPVIMLQSIQTMLNEIDISNYFVCIVTTNPDVADNYDWVLKNISTDPIPLHLYKASGDYINLQSDYIPYKKFSGLGTNSQVINSMTDLQKSLFLNSKNFCILPWVSLYTKSHNSVTPCCWFDDSLGNANINSLEEIWNGDKLKQLRLDMLAEKSVPACKRCYIKEQVYKDDTVYRASYNRQFINEFQVVESTNSDGSLDTFDLKLINYKHDNLCNLQCRMCNSDYSSSLHTVELALNESKGTSAHRIGGRSKTDLYEQFTKHVDSIQQIIFEGGEPLMIKETYDFVDLLDQRQRHDVQLMYITNMTQRNAGKRDIFDTWTNFKNICVYASVDAENDKAVYLRPGTKWDHILNFRKEMIERRPDIFFCVHSTLTILNALHMPDFHRSWVEQGLVSPEHWLVNTLVTPHYLNVTTAPQYLKDQIKEKYRKHLEWLRPLDPFGKSSSGYISVLHALNTDNVFDSDLFWTEIEKRDQYYDIRLLDYFPELVDLTH